MGDDWFQVDLPLSCQGLSAGKVPYGVASSAEGLEPYKPLNMPHIVILPNLMKLDRAQLTANLASLTLIWDPPSSKPLPLIS